MPFERDSKNIIIVEHIDDAVEFEQLELLEKELKKLGYDSLMAESAEELSKIKQTENYSGGIFGLNFPYEKNLKNVTNKGIFEADQLLRNSPQSKVGLLGHNYEVPKGFTEINGIYRKDNTIYIAKPIKDNKCIVEFLK